MLFNRDNLQDDSTGRISVLRRHTLILSNIAFNISAGIFATICISRDRVVFKTDPVELRAGISFKDISLELNTICFETICHFNDGTILTSSKCCMKWLIIRVSWYYTFVKKLRPDDTFRKTTLSRAT